MSFPRTASSLCRSSFSPHIYRKPTASLSHTSSRHCSASAATMATRVGKGTLYNRLFARHPDTFCLSVSHTTRSPRDGEKDKVHYHFVTMQEFEDLIAKDGFVEHAQFSGNRYGTSKMTIEEQGAKGKVVLLDIEMEGVKQIKQSDMNARYIFIAPPSLEILESRLRGRGTEKEESIQKRLRQAKNEIEYSQTTGVHDMILVNNDLDKAYEEFEAFAYKPKDS